LYNKKIMLFFASNFKAIPNFKPNETTRHIQTTNRSKICCGYLRFGYRSCDTRITTKTIYYEALIR